MATLRLLFHRSTGLGDQAVEAGETLELDETLAQKCITAGRATLAPGEPELPLPPPGLTTEAVGLTSPAPKKGRAR